MAYQAFTVRIPVELVAQIEARSKLFNRSRNAEVVYLLTKAIDESVSRDLKLLKAGQKPSLQE